MPTPGGLLKAGDRITDGETVYIVLERTSTSAPYSVWIRRQDHGHVLGFRSDNLRARGTEARLSLETGKLPGRWRYLSPGERINEFAATPLPPLQQIPDKRRIWVRLVKATQFFTGWEHQDVDITDLTFWERPGTWQVACIAIGEKGLPPWDDKPTEFTTT